MDRESIERASDTHMADAASTLKRKASPSFDATEDPDTRTGKRRREDTPQTEEDSAESASERQNRLAEELALDLQCGCCSDLVINPVIVLPCQHFFCGSCVVQWIKNGGTNCPACRSVSTSVAPFRTMAAVVDTLLRIAPEKARPEREVQQADAIYRKGSNLRIPVPRTASPEPNLNPSTDFARPCPHCAPHNPYGWQCPQPIADPNIEPDNAWPLDDGLPPGHGHCGNCENLMALNAPASSKCDFCHIHFCGIGVQGRCQAGSLLNQQPHGMMDVADLIQSADVYECFDSNYVEVEIMLDYLTAQQMTPRHIYREIVMYLQTQPRGFQPLIDQGLFMDSTGGAPVPDPNPDAPRRRICRVCATEILLWGIRDWWVRERAKGFLEEHILARKDCPAGNACENQKDMAHAKEFNHIFAERTPDAAGPSGEGESAAPPARHPLQLPTEGEHDVPPVAVTGLPHLSRHAPELPSGMPSVSVHDLSSIPVHDLSSASAHDLSSTSVHDLSSASMHDMSAASMHELLHASGHSPDLPPSYTPENTPSRSSLSSAAIAFMLNEPDPVEPSHSAGSSRVG